MKTHGRRHALVFSIFCSLALLLSCSSVLAQPTLTEIESLRAAAKDPALNATQRLEKFNEARRLLRELIDDPEMAGHPLRPVWRTDLAEMLLVTHLQGFRRSAPAFVEFGVPTDEQRQVFGQDVPIALVMLERAEQEFADLESRLDRDVDLRAELESSPDGARIFDEYRDQRTPWFKANAAHYATLLPDSHPYFGGIERTPDAERARLRRAATTALRPFVEGDIGGDALQRRAQSLAGRVVLAEGNTAQAETDYLAAAVAGNGSDSGGDGLAASIARALATEQTRSSEAGQSQLAELANRSNVRERIYDRLLVTDALHLMRLRAAEEATGNERIELADRAYAVYFDLLADPSLGPQAPALRNLIYSRWASTFPTDADGLTLARVPGRVRAAVAEMARRRGLLALQQGETDRGREQLERAVTLGFSLDNRAAVGDEAWAIGRYNRAYATYALEPKKLGSLLSAAELATDVAEQTPGLAVATDAIDLASRILESLHRNYAAQPGVTPAFERAMRVLYESGDFDTTKPADDRLLYYAFAVFESRGDYEAAAELYARQLKNHPNYLAAQAQRVAVLSEWFSQTSAGSPRNRIEAELMDAARRATEAATPVWRNAADAGQADAAARAIAHARLAKARIAATRGDLEGALFNLKGFESDFADRPELVRLGLERRLLILVDGDRLSDAQDAAGAMMGRFPDAAAGVINNVLGDMEGQIAELGDSAPRSARLADAAAAMAKLLADWAEGQGFDARQMLPYRLVVLKSLRIANRPDEALAYLRDTRLDADFANNVDVLFEKARALVSRGDEAALREATPILNRILGGLSEPYPETYWRAWITRLEINLALGEGVAEVVRRVRQLEQSHPDLGGPRFKEQFEALRDRAIIKR
ncbi:MAG: hypothetical protein AAGH99_15730 [Planctomycetota bacterium]